MTVFSDALPSLLAGEIPDADKFQDLSDALAAFNDAWTTYTSAWNSTGTAPALVNGTLTAEYMRLGKWVAVRIILQPGSSTTFGTGAYGFTLPVQPKADQSILAFLNDSSASLRFDGQAWIISATVNGDNMRIVYSGESGFANMTPTSPITLATTDKLILMGVYQANV